MGVIYEVNISIDPDILTDYLAWLKPHMDEMLTFPGFSSHRLLKIQPGEYNSDTAGEEGWVCFVATYQVDTMENLQEYFDVHSKKMRGDGVKRFTGQFRCFRRTLHDAE